MNVGDLVISQVWTRYPLQLGVIVGYDGNDVVEVFIRGDVRTFLDEDLKVLEEIPERWP